MSRSQQGMEEATVYLQQVSSVDVSILMDIPDLDLLLEEASAYLRDVLNSILEFIDQVKVTIQLVRPEVDKLRLLIKALFLTGNTFVSMLQTSVQLNTSSGQTLVDFSGFASSAEKMRAGIADLQSLVDQAIPDQTLFEALDQALNDIKTSLLDIKNGLSQ